MAKPMEMQAGKLYRLNDRWTNAPEGGSTERIVAKEGFIFAAVCPDLTGPYASPEGWIMRSIACGLESSWSCTHFEEIEK